MQSEKLGMYEQECLAIQALTNDEVTALTREFDTFAETHRTSMGLRRAVQRLGLGWKVRIHNYTSVVIETKPQPVSKGEWNVIK